MNSHRKSAFSWESVKLNGMCFFTSHFKVAKGQPLLLVQLARYLYLKDGTGTATKSLRDSLTKLKGGACFGWSVLNQVMKCLGKDAHDQWKEIKCRLANWDGTKKTLEQKVIFPGFKDAVTLDRAIELALNYIIYHHADGEKAPDFAPWGMDQRDLLDPEKECFEIVFSNKEPGKDIKHIQDRKRISACFTKEQVVQMLDEEQAENDIFLMLSGCHTIDISYSSRDHEWTVHDSNLNHTSVVTMEKKCATKEAVVNAIIKRMNAFPVSMAQETFDDSTIPVTVEIASWEKGKEISVQAYEKLMQNPSPNMLKNEGLILLVIYNPEALLAMLDKDVFKTTEGIKAFANALIWRDKKGRSAVNYLSSEFFHCLLKKKIFQHPEVKKAFAQAVKMFDKNMNGFHSTPFEELKDMLDSLDLEEIKTFFGSTKQDALAYIDDYKKWNTDLYEYFKVIVRNCYAYEEEEIHKRTFQIS